MALEHELESLHELELEGELEGEGFLGALGNVLGGLFGEGELEGETELELEGEGELELSPVRKVYTDAMMEHLAHMAAEAETEQEAAEHFLPLIGMAASKLLPVIARAATPMLRKALPRVARAVTQVSPQLTRGVGQIARTLHRNPGTRPLVHALPAIARRTMHSVAQQAAQGRPVTSRTAVRTLSQQAQRVLGSRPQRQQAIRRSRAMDRHFHGRIGSGMMRPHRQTGHVHPGYGAWLSAGVSSGGTGRTGACHCCSCHSCAGPATTNPAPAYCRCCGQILR